MARINNLTNFLQDVADSIKTKKEYSSSQKIHPADFDTEIASIETGSDVSGVTATAGDVRETKVFVNSNGEEVQGTFPDATAVYTEISLEAQKVICPINSNGTTTYFDGNWYYKYH